MTDSVPTLTLLHHVPGVDHGVRADDGAIADGRRKLTVLHSAGRCPDDAEILHH
jgi:hypothetical protein